MTQREDLLAAVRGALDLVREERLGLPKTESLISVEPLGSLLDQCRAWHSSEIVQAHEPIRTVHHFACTGGTLISKCLAVLPNTRVLSEIAPLSRLGLASAPPRFLPSDLPYHLKTGLRPYDDESLAKVFLAGLRVAYDQCRSRGEHLVLRDHPHSQFCDGPEIGSYKPLDQMVSEIAPVLAAVTVRHPLASYLSLLRKGWEHYAPKGLDEYCFRYEAFLDSKPGKPVFRYEDFVREPQRVLREICTTLELPWSEDAVHVFALAKLSGDSGRGGTQIEQHPPRKPDETFMEPAMASAPYQALCARLGYDPSGEE